MKKIFLPIIMLFMMLSVVGCSDEISNVDENKNNEDIPNNTLDQEEGNGSEGSNNDSNLTPEYVTPSIDYETSQKPSVSTPVEETVEAVYDSVVSIEVSATTFTASGSGVLFSCDEVLGLSYIVTCFHVVEDATYIDVVLTNDEVYQAELVGGYRDEDLAVLSIKKTNLTYAKIFEDSEDLKLGSQVVCIGNPLGTLPGSVSSGYLSYKNRLIQVDDYTYMSLLQTDVAINSGNSGGGLFNTSGALIGIVNAKYADEAIEGLGFAIPSNTVKDVIADFISTAKYDKANNKWEEGYVIGDWELGFTVSDGRISTGGYPFGGYRYVVYISNTSLNETAFGSDLLYVNDIINSVSVDYLSADKTDFDITFSQASDVINAIYSANLELGDKIKFSITRDNSTIEVVIDVTQYIYSV